MSLDLTPYPAIGSALFIKLTTFNSTGIDEVITFSDYHRSFDLDGTTYTGLGQFMTITETSSDLRATNAELTITLSGIVTSTIDLAQDFDLKGSTIEIYRGIFDPTTMTLLSIAGNPAGRFIGYVVNYAIDEEYDIASRNSTISVALICSSTVGLLQNKLSGRATNPWEQRDLYPGDAGMDRVPNIANANYNFGAP